MNHRPKQPGPRPPQPMSPNRGPNQGRPVPPQRPPVNHQRRPVQQGSPIPDGMPPLQQGQPPQYPPHPQQQRPIPPNPGRQQPNAKFVNEEFGNPVRRPKPIPASVPSVDVDAISSALSELSQELDHMEQSGRVSTPVPEAIDDLIVIDMYTPKEKIPASKRQQAAQTVALQGPAEEGANIRQNQLIQALRAAPSQMRGPSSSQQAPQQQNVSRQTNDLAQKNGEAGQQLPEPKVFNREPDKPQSPKNDASGINPDLDAFEAAVYSKGPGDVRGAAEKEKPIEEREQGDLSQDGFSERLQLKSNAYRVERDDSTKSNDEQGMSLDELHAYYASQKEGAEEDLKAQEAFLSNNNQAQPTAGGFLSGLGAGDPLAANSQPDPLLQDVLSAQEASFSTSGGFLTGVESSSNQGGAIASRSIGGEQSIPSPQANSGGGFLDSLNAFNQPQEPVIPQNPLPANPQPSNPGFGELWQTSDSISPAARAYRDSVLYGDNPPQPQQPPQPLAPVVNTPLNPPVSHHPAMQGQSIFQQPPPQQRPLQQPIPPHPVVQNDSPSFLSKPSLQRTEEPAVAPKAPEPPKKVKSSKEKISSLDKKRRRAIQIYYGKRSVWTILTALTGIGLISSQGRYDPIREWVVMTPSWILLAGMVLFALSVVWRYLSIRKPKEETLDDWAAEDLMNLERRAFETMKLQNRYLLLEPIVMSGFPDIESVDDEFVNGLYGKDHILRYTPRALTVMCFTRSEILTYEGAIDLTTGQVVYETAREFFYADVATVGMVKSKVRRRIRLANIFVPWRWFFVEGVIRLLSGRTIDRSAINKKDAFQISLKDGSKVQLILRDARVLRENTFEELPLSTDEKVLQAITEFVVVQKQDQLAGYR